MKKILSNYEFHACFYPVKPMQKKISHKNTNVKSCGLGVFSLSISYEIHAQTQVIAHIMQVLNLQFGFVLL